MAPQGHTGPAQEGERCGAWQRPGQELARGSVRGFGQSLRQQPCRGSVGNLRGRGPGKLSSAGHCREGLGWLPQSLRKRFWRAGPGNGVSGEGAAAPPHADSQRLPVPRHSALGSAGTASTAPAAPPALCSHQRPPHAEVCGAAWGTPWHPGPTAAAEPGADSGSVQGRTRGAHGATPRAQSCLLPRTQRHLGHHSRTGTSRPLHSPAGGTSPQPCSCSPTGSPGTQQHPPQPRSRRLHVATVAGPGGGERQESRTESRLPLRGVTQTQGPACRSAQGCM